MSEHLSPLVYSSRSRIESFLDCPRLGFIRYLWDDRGLRKRAASVYLSTGTYTHIGLEYLFRLFHTGELDEGDLPAIESPSPHFQYHVDVACTKSLTAYMAEIKERGFDLEEGENKENEQFVIMEQCALVEAFIRSFASRILPDLLNRYKVVDVEREEAVTFGQLVVEGRIDVTFEERSTADIYITSFKTAALWDRRQEKANEHDNQGLSETFILENRLRQENQVINGIANGVETIHGIEGLSISHDVLISINPKIIIAAKKFKEYVGKFKRNEKVMGVIMIYLLKGKRYESSSRPGLWEQHSPLIRGYRKLVGTDYEYAGSLWYSKPENKSGWGKLGKGWEPFNVWESEEVGFIKGWVAKLADPSNSLGQDVIGNSFKIPAPYFRNQDHIDSWVRQAQTIERRNQHCISELEILQQTTGSSLNEALDYLFPQRRKGCHYPVDCEMLDICYNREVFDDPIGSGKFVYRQPHHKLEREAHAHLYQISEDSIEKQATKKEMQGTSQSNNGDNSKQGMERGTSEEISVLGEEIIIDE